MAPGQIPGPSPGCGPSPRPGQAVALKGDQPPPALERPLPPPEGCGARTGGGEGSGGREVSLVWGAGRALRSEAALVLLSHTSRGLWGPLSTHCPGRFDARPWRGQTHAGSDVGAVGSGGPSSEGLTADPLRRPPPGRHRQASTPRRGKRGPPAFAGRSPRPRRWWQLGADSEPVALGRAPAPRPKGESDPRGPLAQPSPPSLRSSSSTRLLGKGYSWVCPTGAQHGARVTLMSASQSVLVRRRGGLCLRLDNRPGPALCVCVWGALQAPLAS